MPHAHAGGVSIHYQTLGHGPPLLMLMGMGGSGDSWGDEFTRHLARRFRLLLPDNRGTGRTPRGDAPYTIARLAADATAVLDAEGVSAAHVLGISMGGMVAQELAIGHPRRAGGLVLGCTTAGGRAFVPPRGDALREVERLGLLGAVGLVTTPEFATRHPGRLARLGLRGLARPTPRDTWEAQLAAIATFDASTRLGRITAPTLVITGDRDLIMPPENSRRLLRGIHGARGVMVKGTGHCFFWEAPARAARAIEEFLGPLALPTAA
jgi:pimeloyl-ACP methyl ester carboxylesterase